MMTVREQLHQLVEELPEDRAGDALEVLRLIAHPRAHWPSRLRGDREHW
jgi:hypothetical protein